MGLFGFFSKKKVPDELPDLATDELAKKTDKEDIEKDKDIISSHLNEQEKKEPKKEDKKEKEEKPKEADESGGKKEEVVSKLPSKSFFSDLRENINSEINDLDKLEEWYKQKFMPQDVVANMRRYWEDQKANSVLEVLGRNFKERIDEKTKDLQNLEKEWQNIYFDLIEKEEEIKDEEEELKRILAEFVEVCKKKKLFSGTDKDGQKKDKKPKKKDSD